MKKKVKKSKKTDKKEWLRELASGDAMFYLAMDLVRLIFEEKMDPYSWVSTQATWLCEVNFRLEDWETNESYSLDAACSAGDIFMGLVMDTDRKPDMNAPVIYSSALKTSRNLESCGEPEDCEETEDCQAQERTLLVYITEHSCLKNRWYEHNEMGWSSYCPCNEEKTCEWHSSGANYMIIDLENFQKNVPAPQSFLEQFLKILAESKTLDEARTALDAAVENRYQAALDEIARLEKELAEKEKAQQS